QVWNGNQRLADARRPGADRTHGLTEGRIEPQESAEIEQQATIRVSGRSKDDQGRNRGVARLEYAQRIRDPLRYDEISLLNRKLPRPQRQRAAGRVGDTKLADAGDHLQHQAADLALQVEMLVLVVDAHRARADDHKC